MEEKIPEVFLLKVNSLNDLARLASTMAAHLILMPIYRYISNDKTIYFVQATYKDYYKYYGIPIIYFYEAKEEINYEKARYILIKTDEVGEKVEVSDKIKPGFIAIPIINIEGRPPFFP
ncbi:MAG: hypothetical protein ACP5I6_07260 [Caldisphaera sp.]|nr:hypothetical protein [Caldisphaera sp.]PMP90189.1 MAG: hypothetical protein C0171_05700 [Caldisphaera sp.]